MILTVLYKWLAIVGAVLILVVSAFFYGVHTDSSAWKAREARAESAAEARVLQWQAKNSVLSAADAAAQAKIDDLQTQITQQLPQVERIYVKVPGKTITRVVSRTVYISVGLVQLYDRSLGLPGPAAAGQFNDGAEALSSDVSLDDYFAVSLANNGACLANTTQLSLLQSWVRGLK
ncbi:MAG: hypothetical protein ACYDCJ_12900 [Gammaproteobacteria bacterium]